MDTARTIDNAEGMAHWSFSSSCLASGLALAAAGLTGCTRSPPVPTKVIETSPDGHPRLLPLSAATSPVTTWPTSTVAPAAFYEPVEVRPIKPYTQWTEQEAAADALGRIGPAAVPGLIEALRSSDPTVRRKAADVLGRLGSDAKDATPDLVRLLDDPDESVRKAAARTLGRIGPPAEEAVPALMRTLLQP